MLQEKVVRRLLLGALVVLNLGNLVFILRGRPHEWLLLTNEQNPSTWWNSLLYAAAGALLLAAGEHAARRRGWQIAGALAFFLSVEYLESE